VNEINDLAGVARSDDRATVSANWRFGYGFVIARLRGRGLWWLLWVGVILVLTVPWDLKDHMHWYNVTWRPFTGVVRPHDLLLNFVLYLPFGALAPIRRDRLLVVALMAALLAGACELSQVWSHSRFPSMTDVVMNTLGAVAGRLWRKRAVT